MIMNDDDTRTVAADSGTKHLGGAHNAGVDCALINSMLGDHVVFRVEAEHAQLLLRLVSQIKRQKRRHIAWPQDLRTFRGIEQRQAASDLQRRLESDRLRRPKSTLRA